MEEALKFYADVSSWYPPCTPECCDIPADVDIDLGKRARDYFVKYHGHTYTSAGGRTDK
jgi:hypothetical protein